MRSEDGFVSTKRSLRLEAGESYMLISRYKPMHMMPNSVYAFVNMSSNVPF